MKSLLIPWRQAFGRTKMLRRESFVSCSEDAQKTSLKVVKAALEEKSMSFFVETLLPPNLSFCSMSIKLRQEESTHLERVPPLSVSLSILPKIPKPRSLSLRVELLFSLTVVSVASTSSIRWMTIQELSFTKQWNNRQSQSLKLESFAPSMLEQPSLPLPIQ